MTPSTAANVNLIATFLGAADASSLAQVGAVDCIVLCCSSVLLQAERFFDQLQAHGNITKYLVLCGGVGHSTQFVYDAVASSPRYRALASDVVGLPEARVLQMMMNHSHPAIAKGDRFEILIEEKSTNCGNNATFTRDLLKSMGIHPRSILLVQDPTMSLRTIKSLEQAYAHAENPPNLKACPLIDPKLEFDGHRQTLRYVVPDDQQLLYWPIDRYLNLVAGEIPRLRDDAGGYGPQGKGFIAHADIPDEVEAAYEFLMANVNGMTRA